MSSRIVLSRPPVALAAGTAAWPAGLDDLPDAPASLIIAGELPRLRPAVAIVGTRFADADALAFTRQLAFGIAVCGVPVVSGGASGVDAAAHRGALDADGLTVAVLASGLSHAYPREHAPLFAEIARSGALVCEPEAVKHQARRWAFLRRNRLIAALADTVVVVQAPEKSGALATAAWAKRLKRRLFVVPAAPWDPRGAGCIRLLREGAMICTSAADVLSVRPSQAEQTLLPGLSPLAISPARSLPVSLHGHAQESKNDAGLHEASRKVLEHLGRRACHPDQLAQTLDMTAAEVQEALLVLVLAGLVKQDPNGSYLRIPD